MPLNIVKALVVAKLSVQYPDASDSPKWVDLGSVRSQLELCHRPASPSIFLLYDGMQRAENLSLNALSNWSL